MTGLDLEIDWRLNDYFFLDASATFLDSKIEDHIGTCFAGQTVEQGCDVGCDPNTPSGSLPFTPGAAQDRSGIHLAPDLELNLGLRYQHLLASGASLRADVYVRYRYEFTQPAREFPTFDEFTRWDAAFVYTSPDERWQLRLFGKKLTDEKILAGWVDSPRTGGTAGLPEGRRAPACGPTWSDPFSAPGSWGWRCDTGSDRVLPRVRMRAWLKLNTRRARPSVANGFSKRCATTCRGWVTTG